MTLDRGLFGGVFAAESNQCASRYWSQCTGSGRSQGSRLGPEPLPVLWSPSGRSDIGLAHRAGGHCRRCALRATDASGGQCALLAQSGQGPATVPLAKPATDCFVRIRYQRTALRLARSFGPKELTAGLFTGVCYFSRPAPTTDLVELSGSPSQDWLLRVLGSFEAR